VFDKVRVDLGNSPKIVNVSDVCSIVYGYVTAPGRCHTRVRQFRGAQSLDTQIGRLDRIEFSKIGRPTHDGRYVYYNIRVKYRCDPVTSRDGGAPGFVPGKKALDRLSKQ
jgi:hypothetical protein